MPHLASYGSDLLALAIATGVHANRGISSPSETPPSDKWSPGARRVLDQAIAGSNHARRPIVAEEHAGPPTMGNSNVPLLGVLYRERRHETFRRASHLRRGSEYDVTQPGRLKIFYRNSSRGVCAIISRVRRRDRADVSRWHGKHGVCPRVARCWGESKRATKRYKMLPLYLAAQSGPLALRPALLGSGPPPDQLRVEISLASHKSGADQRWRARIQHDLLDRARRTLCHASWRLRDHRQGSLSRLHSLQSANAVLHAAELLRFRNARRIVPRYPASHGCIRLPGDAARKFFDDFRLAHWSA